MKVMHKVGIHRTRVDDEGNIALKYSSSPDLVLELDKGETITVMDMFTKHGYAVVVFPPELEDEKEEEPTTWTMTFENVKVGREQEDDDDDDF